MELIRAQCGWSYDERQRRARIVVERAVDRSAAVQRSRTRIAKQVR